MKTVSVVMCTYNGAKYIRQQLDSIIAQKYPIEEVIVQDDGSNDGTIEIVEEYSARHPYIHLYRNEVNKGFNMNFITAFQRAKTDFVAISDQDDIWFSDKIERQVEAIGDKYAACCTDHYRDEKYSDRCTFRRNPQNTFESQIFTSHVPGHCLLVRTSFLKSIDNWDKHIPYDWWIVINAHFCGGLAKAPYPLNWYRPYAESVATKHRAKYQRHAENPTWQPYIFGMKDFRQLQKRELWSKFYGYINLRTATADDSLSEDEKRSFRLVHKLTGLMLRKDIFSLLKLCFLCMKHRDVVHGKKHPNIAVAMLRGFFYPFIWAYSTTNFDY
jgi:glycosyltransferase involved in cell wall biosynthesis